MRLRHGGGRRRVIGALLALVLLLGGCARFTMSVDIVSDQDVAVNAHLAVEKANIEALGQRADAETVCRQVSGLPPGVRARGYDRDGFIGCRIEGRGSLAGGTRTGLSVARDGAEYAFGLRPGDQFGDPQADQAPVAAIDQLSVAVTFPGQVTRHNGSSTVSGTTVTWSDPQDLFSAEGLSARGRTDRGPARWLPWVIGASLALAVAGLGLVLIIRGRRTRATVGRDIRAVAAPPTRPPSQDPWAAWHQTSRWSDPDPRDGVSGDGDPGRPQGW